MSEAPARAVLRLYIARSTPNSTRAQHNLRAALLRNGQDRDDVTVELIDVLSAPKRALTEGVIATPTLVASGRGVRQMLIGDLTDAAKLQAVLQAVGLED